MFLVYWKDYNSIMVKKIKFHYDHFAVLAPWNGCVGAGGSLSDERLG
jgi:hypothetical protein